MYVVLKWHKIALLKVILTTVSMKGVVMSSKVEKEESISILCAHTHLVLVHRKKTR